VTSRPDVGQCAAQATTPGQPSGPGGDRVNAPTNGRVEESGEILSHLALALIRHVRQLRHDGLRVPALVDDLTAFLAHCVRSRLGATPLDAVSRAAHDGRVARRLLITKAEAAEQLGVSVRTIERLVAAGRLPMVHVEGAARLRQADLEAYVDSLVTAPNPADQGADVGPEDPQATSAP
jgi:excisionase family DNA binding protein